MDLKTLWTDYNRPDLSSRANSISTWNRLDNQERYNEVRKNPKISTYSESDFNYSFNSFGFRSCEFDNDAKTKILYVGCSFTEGIGLPVEDTWCYQLNQLIAPGIKMFNIGKAGASIDLCIRLAYTTIEHKGFKPDFVFFLMPPLNRNEFIYIDEEQLNWFDFAPSNSAFKNSHERVIYSSAIKNAATVQRFSETVRNLLFFKLFLETFPLSFSLCLYFF
jgi:hypothetical protein